MTLRFGACLAVFLMAGCGSSPSTTLLTLDAVAPPPASIHADYRGPAIIVPAVHVPAVLDRIEFVRQVSAGSAKVDDFAHWAAPLGLLTRDALVRNLTARLPEGSVLPPGATGDSKGLLTLDVTILSFDTTTAGATMQAAYRTLPHGVVRQASLDVAHPVSDPISSAQAYAMLVAKLADRMAADLSTTPLGIAGSPDIIIQQNQLPGW
jgi:uncharacterized lipoprotein YmbA